MAKLKIIKHKYPIVYNDFFEGEINGNYYEVIFEPWNVILSKNGETIFDKRRFENKELLKLLI